MLFAAVLSAWIQYAFDGAPQARALVTHSCPRVSFDGGSAAMKERAPQAPEQGFDEAVCEATLPAAPLGHRVSGPQCRPTAAPPPWGDDPPGRRALNPQDPGWRAPADARLLLFDREKRR